MTRKEAFIALNMVPHLGPVRLRRLLRGFHVPVDLLVVSESKYEYWRDTPGNVYHEAATDGVTLYEAA